MRQKGERGGGGFLSVGNGAEGSEEESITLLIFSSAVHCLAINKKQKTTGCSIFSAPHFFCSRLSFRLLPPLCHQVQRSQSQSRKLSTLILSLPIIPIKRIKIKIKNKCSFTNLRPLSQPPRHQIQHYRQPHPRRAPPPSRRHLNLPLQSSPKSRPSRQNESFPQRRLLLLGHRALTWNRNGPGERALYVGHVC